MDNIVSIIAPYSWLKSRVDRLFQSAEKAKEYEDSRSFLSCIYFCVRDGVVTMQSECMMTTTLVTASDLDVVGEGEFLVTAQDLREVLVKMPHDSDVVITYYMEDTDGFSAGEINVETVSGDIVSFAIMDVPIDGDVVPKAVRAPDGDNPMACVEVADLKKSYKLASSMAKPMDADQLVGQDPLSSCAMSITQDGIAMFSLFTSSSMFTVTSHNVEHVEETPTVFLSSISLMNACINTFSDNVDVDVIIEGDRMMYLQDEDTVMSINSINGGAVNAGISSAPIIEQFNVMFPHAVAHVDVNPSTFFSALGRAKTGTNEDSFVDVTSDDISVFVKNGKRTSFCQTIPSQNTWLDDGERLLTTRIDVNNFKKVQGIAPDNDGNIRLSVVFQEDNPWCIIVYNKDTFDESHPDNFFLISTIFND